MWITARKRVINELQSFHRKTWNSYHEGIGLHAVWMTASRAESVPLCFWYYCCFCSVHVDTSDSTHCQWAQVSACVKLSSPEAVAEEEECLLRNWHSRDRWIIVAWRRACFYLFFLVDSLYFSPEEVMTSVWKRLQRVGKKASKFQFVASYQELVLECTKKWWVWWQITLFPSNERFLFLFLNM